jgi:hypothetical protein
MATIPFYHQVVMFKWSKLTDISTISTEKIWNCKDCHYQIWIDHFDHENFIILGMVLVKIGLTCCILTLEPQFWPNGQKNRGHRTLPPPIKSRYQVRNSVYPIRTLLMCYIPC